MTAPGYGRAFGLWRAGAGQNWADLPLAEALQLRLAIATRLEVGFWETAGAAPVAR